MPKKEAGADSTELQERSLEFDRQKRTLPNCHALKPRTWLQIFRGVHDFPIFSYYLLLSRYAIANLQKFKLKVIQAQGVSVHQRFWGFFVPFRWWTAIHTPWTSLLFHRPNGKNYSFTLVSFLSSGPICGISLAICWHFTRGFTCPELVVNGRGWPSWWLVGAKQPQPRCGDGEQSKIVYTQIMYIWI